MVRSKEVPFLRYGPLFTKITNRQPPKTDSPEIDNSTISQEKACMLSFNKCGNAVPKTRAPTKNLERFLILFGNNL